MASNVLITGATGLVGQALLPLLQDKQVHVLTTRKELAHQSYDNIRYFYWNPEQDELDTTALENVSAIIHLAGTSIAGKRWSNKRKQSILDSRIKGLNLLYLGLKSINHQVQQLISASGTGWYAPNPIHLYQESEPVDTHNFLGQVCNQWEQAAHQFEDLGIKVATVRTGMVIAPKGGAMDPIKMSLITPIIPQFGNGKQLVAWISLIDLVSVYKHILVRQLSGPFNATATKVTSHGHMMNALAQYKWKKFYLKIPIPSFFLAMVMGKMANELLIQSRGTNNDKLLATSFSFSYPQINSSLMNYIFPKS